MDWAGVCLSLGVQPPAAFGEQAESGSQAGRGHCVIEDLRSLALDRQCARGLSECPQVTVPDTGGSGGGQSSFPAPTRGLLSPPDSQRPPSCGCKLIRCPQLDPPSSVSWTPAFGPPNPHRRPPGPLAAHKPHSPSPLLGVRPSQRLPAAPCSTYAPRPRTGLHSRRLRGSGALSPLAVGAAVRPHPAPHPVRRTGAWTETCGSGFGVALPQIPLLRGALVEGPPQLEALEIWGESANGAWTQVLPSVWLRLVLEESFPNPPQNTSVSGPSLPLPHPAQLPNLCPLPSNHRAADGSSRRPFLHLRSPRRGRAVGGGAWGQGSADPVLTACLGTRHTPPLRVPLKISVRGLRACAGRTGLSAPSPGPRALGPSVPPELGLPLGGRGREGGTGELG